MTFSMFMERLRKSPCSQKPLTSIYGLHPYIYIYIFPSKAFIDYNIVPCRWDLAAIEQLPEYMKICFKALNDITDEISHKIYQKHGWNPIDSLRKTVNACLFVINIAYLSNNKTYHVHENHDQIVAVGEFMQCFSSGSSMIFL